MPFAVTVAILAGGASTRMGRPKATIVLGGLTLVERIATAVTTAGLPEPVVVGGDPSWAGALEWTPDRWPGEGPLGGLLSAFDVAAARGADGVLLLACDLVRPDARALRAVTERLGAGPAMPGASPVEPVEPVDAVVPVGMRPEVLHAAYHVRLQAPLAAAFGAGERSIARALADRPGIVRLGLSDVPGLAASVADADQPGDLPSDQP